jgi:hypothetical protein
MSEEFHDGKSYFKHMYFNCDLDKEIKRMIMEAFDDGYSLGWDKAEAEYRQQTQGEQGVYG